MDHVARRIVLLARHQAFTVHPSTVYSLVVQIKGTYEGGELQSSFTYRIGRTTPGQVVMQLQKRNFTAWGEERVVERAPVLEVPQRGSKDVFKSVAMDIATYCGPTNHMGLDENEDLMTLVCRCELRAPNGEEAQMAAEARMDAFPAETDGSEEINKRKVLLTQTLQALLEDMVGAYRSTAHHISF